METGGISRIAVLMTVHNRKQVTLSCLEALYKSHLNGCRFDVYMTDDGCTDGTPEAVMSYFPDVRILPGDGSLFWNRGMHKAWTAAAGVGYDYYLWLNDDTVLFVDSIQRLLDCSSRYEDKALIVGATCSSDDSEEVTYGGWIDGRLLGLSKDDQECDTISGNIVLVPQFIFDILGYNDPYYRHSTGDTDYGLRAKEKGLSVICAQGLYGICDLHAHMPIWMDASYPLKKRISNLYSPIGNNPIEFFHFRKRHYGFLPACMTFLSNHIHVFFPRLWSHKCK